MIDMSRVKGIVVPLITPLHEDETVDEKSLRRCVRHAVDAGVHGIFVNSTTGEGIALLDEERKRSIEIVIDEVDRKTPVFVGVSDTGTQRVLKNVEYANTLDADAIVAHPYFYYPLNHQSELVAFYNEIIRVSKLPIMLYNIPGTTKIAISIETVRELMKNETIVGIKDSSVDYLYLLQLIELKKTRPDFKIFIGKSNLWTAGILEGADGGLDGISNLIPALCVELYDTIINHNIKRAFELQHLLNDIWKVYECRSFLSGIKGALSLLGLCSPQVTKPNSPVTEIEMAKIKSIMKTHHLL